MMKIFEIKSYGVAELACIYFPLITKNSASNQFRKWLKNNEKLKCELVSYGMIPKQKIFTPKQVEIIVTFLGEP